MIRKSAIRQAIHKSVGERVELLRRPQLRNAGSAVARGAERCNRDIRRACECSVCGSYPVHVEFPEIDAVGSKVEKEAGSAGGRRACGAIQVRWQDASEAGAQLKTLLRGRRAAEHRAPVVGAYFGASEGAAVIEDVERDVDASGQTPSF